MPPVDQFTLQNNLNRTAVHLIEKAEVSNYCCAAVLFDGEDYFVAANGFSPDISNWTVDAINLGSVGRKHAEMAIVEELCNIYGIRRSTDLRKGCFSHCTIGVSKEICQKCAAVLNYLGIRHGKTHCRPTEQDGWEFPCDFFEEIYELNGLNDGRNAFGANSSDGEWLP